MNNETLKLLEDCKDTFEWIVESEIWCYIEDNCSALELINEIDNAIKKYRKWKAINTYFGWVALQTTTTITTKQFQIIGTLFQKDMMMYKLKI
jgi:hypothetical protein